MIEQHSYFVQPANLDVKVWRYMNIAKLLQLLQSAALFFPRADKLGEKFEGSNTIAAVKRLERAASPGHEAELAKMYPAFSVKEARDVVENLAFMRRAALEETYVSCWHASDVESAAMWSLYGGAGQAVAIRATYRQLAKLLPAPTFLGEVQYIDWKRDTFDQGNLLAPFVHKRSSYAHEQEVRAVIDRLGWQGTENAPPLQFRDGGVEVPIPLAELIERVYVSPDAPDWFFSVIEKLIADANLGATVHRSDLSVEPVY